MNLDLSRDDIFRELRALTLVSPGPVSPIRLTHRSEFAATDELYPRTRKPAPAHTQTTHDNTPHTPTDVAALLRKLHVFIQ